MKHDSNQRNNLHIGSVKENRPLSNGWHKHKYSYLSLWLYG